MKNTLAILFAAFILNSKGQILLEHTYDSAATYNVGGGKISQLMKINFEVSGEKFVKINRWDTAIYIYGINHTLEKKIPCSGLPLYNNLLGGVLYLSENLFDTDNEIEFYYYASGGGVNYAEIVNEDGSVIFSDTGGAWIYPGIPSQQLPIYNTSNGTKMILSYPNGQAKVFSLPGILSTAIAEANGQLMQAQSGQGQLSNLYPNPSNGSVILQYELPKGERYGEIVLYDVQGMEVKRYKVDNTFNDILLDNPADAGLPAGTYFYQLQTTKGAVGIKKMVVVK